MDEVVRALREGRLEEARAVVRARFAAGAPADPAWARAAAAAGLAELAIGAWRAVVARAPDDLEALQALADLHEARGDTRRAAACRQRLAAAGSPVAEEVVAEVAEAAPTEGDRVRFVHLFAGRAGVHARMWARGGEVGYAPVQAPLEPGLVAAHLRGDVTVGSYLVRQGDLTGQVVFDLDAAHAAVEAAIGSPERVKELARRLHEAGVAMSAQLRAAGVPHLLFDSGFKGRHAWVFLEPPARAAEARAWGQRWAAALRPADPDLVVELFPKQDHVPAGALGNLVKLPLGVHLRTGRRCHLLDERGAVVDDVWPVLRGHRPAPLPSLAEPPATALVVSEGPIGAPRELPVVAAPGGTPFTEADWEARPRLAAVLAGCAVLRAVVGRIAADRAWSHDERVALEHTLGHWPEGVEGVHWLAERVGAPERMGRPHTGNPSSCKQLARRLAVVADRVGCACRFDAPETYPHPLLHARGVSAAPAAPVERLEDLLERLGRLEARAQQVERELGALRRAAVEGLRRAPGGRFRTDRGEFWLEEVEGLEVVRFTPAGAP